MMTYLERDAELIRRCLPKGTAVPEDSDGLFLMYAVLLRAKGAEVQASDVHDAWSAWMIGVEPGHESVLPFDELDADTRGEDSPFLVAIRAAAALR
ncbi:MAG: DUF7701 domain-containing protein [Microbacterium sp.]|uniref:DUF7701 domain-containing protein n=1 Tax=Microbacterium sp. TaxID=51671 RepID=UPI003F954189